MYKLLVFMNAEISIHAIDEIDKDLERGVVKNMFELIVSTTGEIIHPGEDEEGHRVLKAAYALGNIVLTQNVEKNIYIYNQH